MFVLRSSVSTSVCCDGRYASVLCKDLSSRDKPEHKVCLYFAERIVTLTPACRLCEGGCYSCWSDGAKSCLMTSSLLLAAITVLFQLCFVWDRGDVVVRLVNIMADDDAAVRMVTTTNED